jgi:hypothetical protein
LEGVAPATPGSDVGNRVERADLPSGAMTVVGAGAAAGTAAVQEFLGHRLGENFLRGLRHGRDHAAKQSVMVRRGGNGGTQRRKNGTIWPRPGFLCVSLRASASSSEAGG